jgi:hypothetical protein
VIDIAVRLINQRPDRVGDRFDVKASRRSALRAAG